MKRQVKFYVAVPIAAWILGKGSTTASRRRLPEEGFYCLSEKIRIHHGDTEQMSLLEFNPIGFAIGLKFKQRCFGSRTKEMMDERMKTLFLLPHIGSFAKLGIGGEPITGLGKPPF